ncbi:MAG TPA: aldehyde dehydrogenase (NADP(+)) [Bacteroidales bacterium]|nr:aldehyde dehydrogenase (NADP(+)) [Bacteroidales bacterium]
MESNEIIKKEIDDVMQKAWTAFSIYKNFSLNRRKAFLYAIADELENAGDELIITCMEETNLPESRLKNEKGRTIFQLRSYADYCESGEWLDARIDTAVPDRTPPKPDIRKMNVPLGPVVVFGPSNFPLAYSTGGGDTASALAAGCPVIVKAHPGHLKTSEIVAQLIHKAAEKMNMPEGIFSHISFTSNYAGEVLVKHPNTKAVGFTGSVSVGTLLFRWGNERKNPIPVFAEMGSVNPVFLMPGKINESPDGIAKMYAASITLGAGQFCTNPGIIIGLGGNDLNRFMLSLGEEIRKIAPAKMLHENIARSFMNQRDNILKEKGVTVVAVSELEKSEFSGIPTIATVSSEEFLRNPKLHEEIFGPYSLVVQCKSLDEFTSIASLMEGQLTCTMMATNDDMRSHPVLIEEIKAICGRFIINGVPTGVEVCMSMQHGGPFPATTDGRFTSVGGDAIKRFVRPLAFQNWPEELLPDELKNENPLEIFRTVNNNLTKGRIDK